MFWTKVKGTDSLEMPSILSYPHVKSFVKSFHTKAFLTTLHAKKKFKNKFALEKFIPHMNHQVLGPFALPFFYTFNR
jgi:hypothetical protein